MCVPLAKDERRFCLALAEVNMPLSLIVDAVIDGSAMVVTGIRLLLSPAETSTIPRDAEFDGEGAR